MGTDIHGVFQRHDPKPDKWVDVSSEYEMGRHYQLFAVLAGVRNGYGFAGVPTGEAVKPIARQRGLPEDFEGNYSLEHPVESADILEPWQRSRWKPGDSLTVWMGDHSHSWLLGTEMLEWFASAPEVTKTGVIDRAAYEKWTAGTEPDSYCGGVYGPGAVVIEDNAVARESTPNWTHIRVEWASPLRKELAYFFDEVKRLQELHGSIRFVFGFDS